VDIEPYLHDDTMIDIEQKIKDHITGQAAADEQDYWDNVRKERRHECSEVIQEDCE
jgi:hypothetical protein